MADNYLQFSESLDSLTAAEADWLREQLAEDPLTYCPRFLLDFADREADDSDLGFHYDFHGEFPDHHLWISAEESGAVERVAYLVQKFLQRFRAERSWSLTYANTSSKLRPGEFGGGAVFVTADEIRRNDCYDFIEEQRKTFQRYVEHDRRLICTAAERRITPEQLRAAIHEAAAAATASIDAAGVTAQITYLVEQLGPEATEKILHGLLGPGNNNDGQRGDVGRA
jgi:hypothetical protein